MHQTPTCPQGEGMVRASSLRRRGTGTSRSLAASDLGDGEGWAEDGEPLLSLPQLATGLREGELKDLAYLVVAATCRCVLLCVFVCVLW